MSSGEEQHIIEDDHQLDECAFCTEIFGAKYPFCFSCSEPSTYAHRECIERRMTGSRRVDCPTCELQYCVGYRGVFFDDFVLRAMIETFSCCLPRSYRNSFLNFIITKHTLALVLAVLFLLIYNILPVKDDLSLQQLFQLLSSLVSILALKVSTSSEFAAVQISGSILRARRHILLEQLLVVLVIILSWTTAAKLPELFSINQLYAIWCIVFQILLVPGICYLSLVDKAKLRAKTLDVEIVLFRASELP